MIIYLILHLGRHVSHAAGLAWHRTGLASNVRAQRAQLPHGKALRPRQQSWRVSERKTEREGMLKLRITMFRAVGRAVAPSASVHFSMRLISISVFFKACAMASESNFFLSQDNFILTALKN